MEDIKRLNKDFKTGQEVYIEQACYIMLNVGKPFYMSIGDRRYCLKLERLEE